MLVSSSSEFSSLTLCPGNEKEELGLGVDTGDAASAVSGLASLAEAGVWSLVRPSATTWAKFNDPYDYSKDPYGLTL